MQKNVIYHISNKNPLETVKKWDRKTETNRILFTHIGSLQTQELMCISDDKDPSTNDAEQDENKSIQIQMKDLRYQS